MVRRLLGRIKQSSRRINVLLRGVPLECRPQGDPSGRASPYDSLRFDVGGQSALICYSRPSARGRRIFGDLVPFGELWRTGANEPTILHVPFASRIGGARIPRGRYSLYTVPKPDEWKLIVNRSIHQWGLTCDESGASGVPFQNRYTPRVRAQELASVVMSVERVAHVERFTIRAEPVDDCTTRLLFEWEETRAAVNISLNRT